MTREQIVYAQMGAYIARGLGITEAMHRAEQYVTALETVIDSAEKVANRCGGASPEPEPQSRKL